MLRFAEIFVWWLVLTGVWLLTLTTYSGGELVLAGVAAVPAALAAQRARRAVGGSWWPGRAWLRWSAALPGAVVTDTVRVLAAAVRGRVDGECRTIALADRGDGTSAVAAMVVNAAPGTVVVDAPPGRLVVHALTPSGSTLERVVAR